MWKIKYARIGFKINKKNEKDMLYQILEYNSKPL